MPKYQELVFTTNPSTHADSEKRKETLRSCSTCLFRTFALFSQPNLSDHVPDAWIHGNAWAESLGAQPDAYALFAWLMRSLLRLTTSSEVDLERAARREGLKPHDLVCTPLQV